MLIIKMSEYSIVDIQHFLRTVYGTAGYREVPGATQAAEVIHGSAFVN